MAWNEDDWRLAREAFDAVRGAIADVERASVAMQAGFPEARDRIRRAAAGRAVELEATGRRVMAHGGELPRTEPEARRVLTSAARWKEQFTVLDNYLAEQARLGRIITQPDHQELSAAGWSDARFRLVGVPWMEVHNTLRVPLPGLPRPPAPGDPTRPPRRPGGFPAWLPFVGLGILLLASKKGR